ncbi:predicted protein [Sclerotinia sclerotiorum 1980 UF-70]|uniref:Uncharacterized protein n=1 Tax=Sclerotinia sclerotiorum (strain ATCC 18683 / 1980 / Ss-1) TaxID=665079 RepID=A7EXV1_SCLS1|nr:predicted protein [Sclerotinia sclerotiorum 1980 UF-70]EDN94293.1 predicted protein [Sclerotinia sclerotiorum 1980 UF-70]
MNHDILCRGGVRERTYVHPEGIVGISGGIMKQANGFKITLEAKGASFRLSVVVGDVLVQCCVTRMDASRIKVVIMSLSLNRIPPTEVLQKETISRDDNTIIHEHLQNHSHSIPCTEYRIVGYAAVINSDNA